ncbi:MAG: hypothetical protein A2V85_01595 [Chloroflexi bacterium RBG_16_72_14]|nr:MAG: hypothetical protein A2V85_01595 [Chloroflexi bacterium RBG_16_72_14]
MLAGLALALLVPGTAAAAEDDLPDLSAVAVRADDLPTGFAVAGESGERIVSMFESLAGAFASSPDADIRSVAAYHRVTDAGTEYAVTFLIAPLTASDQRNLDAAFTSTELVRRLLAETYGDMDITLLEGYRVGETRLGLRIVDTDLGIDIELVEARRGPVLSVAGRVLQGDVQASVSLGDVARALDMRLAAVVGAGAPVFRPSGPLVPVLTTHIPSPLDVSTDPAVVGTNLAFAALATLLLTISSKLLTRMLAEHEESIARRVRLVRLVARLEARLGTTIGGRIHSNRLLDLLRLVGIAAFYGLVFSLLEPDWQPLTSAGMWLFISFTIACGVVGIADDLIQWRVARRWGLAAALSVRPTTALLAVASTGVSRLAAVVPGLMFGAPEALRLDESALDEARSRRLTTIGFVALVAIGGASWAATIATTAASRSGGAPAIVEGLGAFLLLVFASTVQNLFVALLGLSGSMGALTRRLSPIAWGGALLAVTFLFWHTLLNPMGDPSVVLSNRNVQVMLGIVGGFTAITVAAWVVLRLASPRPVPAPATQAPTPWGVPAAGTQSWTVPTAAPPTAPAAVQPAPAAWPTPAPPPNAWPTPAPPQNAWTTGAAPWTAPAFGPLAGLAQPGTPVASAPVELSIRTVDGRARGRAWFRIGGGWVTTRVELIDPKARLQYRVFVLLSMLAWLVPFIGYAVTIPDGGRPADIAVAGFLAVLSAWVVALLVGALWVERYRVVHVATFPARVLGGVDVGRDWNLGCALTILLSPLIGLLYLLLAGGRVVRIAGPFAADEPGIVGLRLKGSEAEGRYLAQVLLAARMTG